MELVIAAEQHLEKVITVFDNLFACAFNTRLLGGVAEPVYIPAGDSAAQATEDNSLTDICDYNRLYFREDYFSSALHESAHWCIAGAERRRQLDFGYWYNPDGRSPQQQQVFEKAEIKPQALEWMFSQACGQTFRISADNLAADLQASEHFFQAVADQAQDWCVNPMPSRGELFLNALASQFGEPDFRCSEQYQRTKLI